MEEVNTVDWNILLYQKENGKEPVGNSFVLLHGFVKKTQKTPKRELETAYRYMQDYLRRFPNG